MVLTGVGPGLAYYFPSKIYLSGSLSFSQAPVQDEDGVSIGETDIGVGLHALVGKEWWVSPKWGLGIAGQLFVGSMKDNAENDDAPTWRTVALACSCPPPTTETDPAALGGTPAALSGNLASLYG